jgi:hypothetical protein
MAQLLYKLFLFRFGTLELDSLFIFCKAIQGKFQALNFNSEATFVVHHQLIKHVGFGMLVQENV